MSNESRYQLTRDFLGRGTYATIWRGLDYDIPERQIAIKIIKLKVLSNKELDAVQKEASIAVTLDHPNIVKCYDVVQKENELWLIMELCTGGSMDLMFDSISSSRTKDRESLSKHYIKQLVSAMQYLSERGIIHRDLKPSNLLLTDCRETLKLSDFGFARELRQQDLSATICGSPMYFSPEILVNRKYNHSTDIWSFGVVLYYCLYGVTPFSDCKTIKELETVHRNGKISFPKNMHLSVEALDLLVKTLNFDANSRPSWNDISMHPWFGGEFTPKPIKKSMPIDIKKPRPPRGDTWPVLEKS